MFISLSLSHFSFVFLLYNPAKKTGKVESRIATDLRYRISLVYKPRSFSSQLIHCSIVLVYMYMCVISLCQFLLFFFIPFFNEKKNNKYVQKFYL